MSQCWYKNDAKWEIGEVLSWSIDIMRLRSETLLFPIAIVRCAGGHVQGIYAKDVLLEKPEGHVSFNPDSPNATLDKKAMDFMNSVPSTLNTQEITPQSSDAEVEAAYQEMVQREGGDHSQGGECLHNRPYDPTPHFNSKFDPRPANKSYRFRPRLVNIQNVWWAVQVHPEAIELFDICGMYLCQVKWIDGEVRAPVGGLPITRLREIFEG